MISVIMPVYNEESYIEGCMESLLAQDYPRDGMEWIFVDGCSTDNTRSILETYRDKYPDLIKILDNPQRKTPFAMNIGIAASKGECIVRLDAHSEFPSNYISECVNCLKSVDADNVGGVAETKAKTAAGKTISKVLSSKFGVGNSQFRTNGCSGYVDTVPFGTFKRDVFSKYGGFDERLIRNQDNEINYRIRKNGGKVYLSDKIRFSYYCRDTVKKLLSMARMYGKWNIITMKLCPGAMGLRHFIPFCFVMSIIGLGILGFLWWPIWALLGAELILYLGLDILFSAKSAADAKEFFKLLALFPMFHINYGIGSLLGIFCLFSKKYKKNGYEAPKIQ